MNSKIPRRRDQGFGKAALPEGQIGQSRRAPGRLAHRATPAAEVMLAGEAEALTRKAIELALQGDTVALRLCLERIVPRRKSGPPPSTSPPWNGSRIWVPRSAPCSRKWPKAGSCSTKRRR